MCTSVRTAYQAGEITSTGSMLVHAAMRYSARRSKAWTAAQAPAPAGRQAAPCTCDGVWVVLVCLELVEHVCRGVQGAGPDEAQAGEVQAEQRDLAHQGVQLHIVSNFTGGLQQGW
jgi:hypothetical protein